MGLKLVKLLHKLYKYSLSPIIGNKCRFYPSCSDYAVEAIERHGFFYGSYLTVIRLVRCQPLCAGGLDPVPKAKTKNF